MATAPAIPTQVIIQQGNTDVLLSWSMVSAATSYAVQRSADGITYASLGTSTSPKYLDTTATINTQYWYQVASVNASGTSSYSSALSIIPTRSAVMSLAAIRLAAQQRAEMENSNYITIPEWNSYINQSYFELYDILVTVYEDYYVQTPYTFTTDGTTAQYSLPSDFYKLLGVDLSLSTSTNAWVTLKKFTFIARNRFVYPQLNSAPLGYFNLQYRLVGSTLYFIPNPSSGQSIRVWYVPKLVQLLLDSDVLDGISGWTEYVIVDAAIKALQKEESDCSLLMAQKMALVKRIEESSMNRDAGQPDTVSDVRTRAELWGSFGPPNGDGGYGGF